MIFTKFFSIVYCLPISFFKLHNGAANLQKDYNLSYFFFSGYTCVCPTGVKLKEGSNTTCYNGPQSFLLVAQRSFISKISLDSPDYTPYTLPLKDLKRALTIDFDPKTEYIYWADSLVSSKKGNSYYINIKFKLIDINEYIFLRFYKLLMSQSW